MEGELEDLEKIQIKILNRIKQLEISHLPSQFSSSVSLSPSNEETESQGTTQSRLSSILRSNGVTDFLFKTVPSDYYDRPFESRREILNAASIHHLCKSIVLVNTQAPASVIDCSDRNNSKYYVVVVQYTARFNADSVKNFLYTLNDGKIPKKRFNLRLAPELESLKLTGYEHNGVTCVGMKTDIPVILDEAITRLDPDFFWLGGGEIELKLGIKTSEFINYVKPFIINCSSSS
ncbi:hypothetical protein MKW98_031006 [Papaver atlanticum]|uniref:YbaK/aminoacyl-tRNA synthetase-associated domain-containing protein n=1 Tax=Papaver atlanticum TaxID=357466 RepID=A0AAD4S8A8_9MAGN|nr:hypothetical protein MKW98_031006 [Papaver atlanticum]